MEELVELAKLVGGMPLAALVLLIVMGAFALAAFAIHAVTTIAKKGSRDGST